MSKPKNSKTIAIVKSPTGEIHTVDPVKQFKTDEGDGSITIQGENGVYYFTHISNVLLIEKEVPNEENS